MEAQPQAEPNIDPETGQEAGLVVRGEDGDPVMSPLATKMIEIESFERVVEGLKMAADGAAHLTVLDFRSSATWAQRKKILDNVRKVAVQKIGAAQVLAFEETKDVRGTPIEWKAARHRWKEGLRQAAGGMRQMGSVWRQNILYSQIANQLESLADAAKSDMVSRLKDRGILLPPGYDE